MVWPGRGLSRCRWLGLAERPLAICSAENSGGMRCGSRHRTAGAGRPLRSAPGFRRRQGPEGGGLQHQPMLPQGRRNDGLDVFGRDRLLTGGRLCGEQRRNRPLASISGEQRIDPPVEARPSSAAARAIAALRGPGASSTLSSSRAIRLALSQFTASSNGRTAQPLRGDARVEVPQEIVPGLKFLGKRATRIPGEPEENSYVSAC